MLFGSNNFVNRVSDLSLLSAFTIFKEYRMRLGSNNFVNCVSDLSLLSTLCIFVLHAKPFLREGCAMENRKTA